MSEDTYTIPQAQYEHLQNRISELESLAAQWQTQYEHAQERYEAQFQLNADLIQGVKRLQAEAWDEGANYAIAQAPADVWFEEWTKKLVNPYREA